MSPSLATLLAALETNLDDGEIVKKSLGTISALYAGGEQAISSFGKNDSKIRTLLIRVIEKFQEDECIISSVLSLIQEMLALKTPTTISLKSDKNIVIAITDTLHSFQNDEKIVQKCLDLCLNLSQLREKQLPTITTMVKILVSYQQNVVITYDSLRILERMTPTCREEMMSRKVLKIAYFCLCRHRTDALILNASLDIIMILCEEEEGQKQLLELTKAIHTIFHLMKTNITNFEFQLKGMKVFAQIAQSNEGKREIDDIDGAWNWLTLKENFLSEDIISVPYKCKNESDKNTMYEKEVIWKALKRYQEATSYCDTKDKEKHFGDILRDFDILPKKNEGCDEWLQRSRIFSKKLDGDIVWSNNDRRRKEKNRKNRAKNSYKRVSLHKDMKHSQSSKEQNAINNDTKQKQATFLENEEAQGWTAEKKEDSNLDGK
mmetsp:Transcript_8595/g.12653  ORF Transcript_8595/g.12653 Transcript_8595/m.12653 type:complete len:434 (+) Transcript_8595:425-1726(+)